MGNFENSFQFGLYDSSLEKDACGIGMIAHTKGGTSHEVVRGGLELLTRLKHRGARGADGRTSDGSGIMLEIPDLFLREELPFELPAKGQYACGMVFIPKDDAADNRLEIENLARQLELSVLGWRRVPVDPAVLGAHAYSLEPLVYQIFIDRGDRSATTFDHLLYIFRRKAEKKFRQYSGTRDPKTGKVLTQFYFASLSTHAVVYKGLMLPEDLGGYYPELKDPRWTSAWCLVHSRFSTNTLPAWELAQPFRYICHNGEINTLKGNLNAMRARESEILGQLPYSHETQYLRPLIPEGQSDSASLDQAFEIVARTGLPFEEAVMALIPEAWENQSHLDPSVRDFYSYFSSEFEPWDGPAAVCFCDGRVAGATLDRNGLRPCRYTVSADGVLVVSSEAGAYTWPLGKVTRRGRLAPGDFLLVDFTSGEFFEGAKARLQRARRRPYGALKSSKILSLDEVRSSNQGLGSREIWNVERALQFGFHEEEIRMVLNPMIERGEEATSSMGNDAPLAVFSDRPQLLYSYFRQLFAQVTNPPIDSIREKLVMSLTSYLGGRKRKRLKLNCPILTAKEFLKITSSPKLKSHYMPSVGQVDITVSAKGPIDFATQLQSLCQSAENLARLGVGIIILSDRLVGPERLAIPALLVVSAIHNHLLKCDLRLTTTLLVETGEARDVHHMATLIGFGADAIHPYLALSYARILRGDDGEKNYILAVRKGLLKILSKMGVSTIASYRGAQLFEILGLDDSVTADYFPGRKSAIGGVGLSRLEQDALLRHKQSLAADRLPIQGDIHYRRDGESHLWDPLTILKLQESTRTGRTETYNDFSSRVNVGNQKTIRGQLKIKEPVNSSELSLEDIEPASSIVKRFTTGAMSLGALSQEAHESLALAMNRIGAKSNSGEGGESSDRFFQRSEANSAIKQVASARFGVTTDYLMSAREIQIKMAQGAKPGEGGQLPGHKVDKYIAGLRHSSPGVTLISPPPHHDIYSIEDLAQLIYDLGAVQPAAAISVKLVSSPGVGTVAAGVAKAHADKITISGDGGGTGASPLSSIKHAGMPWEIGLSEAHQTLVINGLRDRVRLEVDGQLRNGRDVVVAALLGADEFGFSTAPLITQGCLMMRKCHLNTCPVGVATQDADLRAKFTGQPEHLINYFFFIAEEVRHFMLKLGVRHFRDLIGRRDWLEASPSTKLNLNGLLTNPTSLWIGSKKAGLKAPPLSSLSKAMLKIAEPALNLAEPVQAQFKIQNVDRAVGSRLSGEVSRRYSRRPLADDTIDFSFSGSTGQSFGAFLTKGITLRLTGEANDYVGKGLSGGRIVVISERPSDVVAGNTCLYGATSGTLLIAGRVGERFAVRNSGAIAVVEGTGDHGCEYMTGGRVVILGPIGRNFAAGMSGGVAYVWDEFGDVGGKINLDMVEIEHLSGFDLLNKDKILRGLLEIHAFETGSKKALSILDRFEIDAAKWLRVRPKGVVESIREIPRPLHEAIHV